MSIPPWKQALLDKKRKQEEEEQRRKQEEEAKLKAIPAWKRAILERNSTKQATQSKPTQAPAAPSQQPTSTTLASLVSKAKPESTIPRENAPKANGWLKSTSIAATTSEKSTKPIVRTSSSSPPKPSPKLWPTVAPVHPLGRSPPTKAKHDAEGDAPVPAEATPTISKPLLERKLSYEREVAKASPPTERRPSAREKTEKGSPLIAGENKRKEVVAATTVATPSDNSIQKEDDAKGGLSVKRGSVRSLLGRFQRGGGASDASNPTFASGRSSLRSSHAKSVGETKKATSESENKVATMPAKVDTKASVEVGVESASENERKAEGNSPEVKMPVSTVGVVTTAPSKNVEMPKGKVERETTTVVSSRTEKTESTEKKVETKAEKKKTLFDAVPQRREETSSKEEVIELTREVAKENKSAAAPAPSKDDVIEKTSPTSETEEAEEALQITNIDDDDDEEEVQVAPVTPVAKQQVEPPKTEDVERRHSAQQEPTKQADVSVALRGAGIESPEKKKKERRRSSLTDPRKPKPQSALRRRVSFCEDLTVEHYYPKAVYEDIEESPDLGRRPLAVVVDGNDVGATPLDATTKAVVEQRRREEETGLSLKPHPSLAPAGGQSSGSSKGPAPAIGGSPSSFLFGSSSLYSYQPKYTQDTLQKKKKMNSKKATKEEKKAAVQEDRVDYTKLNEETAAMLW